MKALMRRFIRNLAISIFVLVIGMQFSPMTSHYGRSHGNPNHAYAIIGAVCVFAFLYTRKET